jgi:imidazolonepropionase-like amidohydrolase
LIRLAALVLLSLLPADGEIVVLTNARILRVSGPEIGKGMIVIEGGKIRRVGEKIDLPEGSRLIDLKGRTVIPGLIDGGCSIGVAGPLNEDGKEVAPQVCILDSIDPRSRDLIRARKTGVTAALVCPGNRGVIGGVSSIIKTAGASRAAMIVREEAALKGSIGPIPAQGNFSPRGTAATFFARRPTTRMGVAWEFRKAFFDAQHYRERHDEVDPGKEVLLRSLSGNLPLRIASSRATDIETAVGIAEEFNLSISFEEAQEAYLRADLLAKRKIPILLRPVLVAPADGNPESGQIRLDTFGLLIRAGVKTALLSVSDLRPEGLLGSVAFAVRYGSSREDALRAVTLTPAEILGIAERMGSLDEGKDADLVILSGSPEDLTSRVESVMIDGRWVLGERASK